MSILAPDYQLLINGTDISPKIKPRLISLTLSEESGETADSLNITLDDTDSRLAIPELDAMISLKLGYKNQDLVDKGEFIFDTINYSAAPNQLVISAHSAAIETALKKRKDYSWHSTKLGDVLRAVAARNNLDTRIDADLANIAYPSVHQQNESDLALVQRLAHEHDATGTIKKGLLIFIPRGSKMTATGKVLPTASIALNQSTNYQYTIERVEAGAVEAKWHSKKGAHYQIVKFGEGTAVRRLSHCFGSADAAMQAAKAEFNNRNRGSFKLSVSIASGRPDLFVGQPVKTTGFKSGIDEKDWIIKQVKHTLQAGLSTTLDLEVAA